MAITVTMNPLKILPLHSEIASMPLTIALIVFTKNLRNMKLSEGTTAF
jgi:hypothetical protein